LTNLLGVLPSQVKLDWDVCSNYCGTFARSKDYLLLKQVSSENHKKLNKVESK